MELSFIVNSVARRWWLVVIGAILGGLVAAQLGSDTGVTYESRALLTVAPPSSANVNSFFDPDRYIAGQITVIDSQQMAEDVEAAVGTQGLDLGAGAVRSMTRAEQRPGTNIVEIVARTDDGSEAQVVAQAYADAYIDSLEDQATQANRAEIDRLRAVEAELEEELTRLGLVVAAAVDEWEAQNPPIEGQTAPNIPSVTVLAPGVDALQQVTIGELNRVKTVLTELESAAAAETTSFIVQNAGVPPEPVSSDSTLITVAGVVFGGVVGLALAVLWSGLSPTVLDEQEAAEIIGHPITASLEVRSVSRTGVERALLDPVSKYTGPIESIAVRCEATGGLRDPLVICVVGSERGAGTTSLSAALAERFANVGARVVLVDGDGRYPELTHASGAGSHLGIAELFAVPADGQRRPDSDYLAQLTPRVSLLGLGGWAGEVGLRSSAVPRVLEAARAGGDVVIIDAGPLLESASANQFVHDADVVVLTMPTSGQKSRDLGHVVRALDCDPERLIVVSTHVHGRRRAKLLGAAPAAPTRPAPAVAEPADVASPAAPTVDHEPRERSFSRWSREATDEVEQGNGATGESPAAVARAPERD